MAAVRAAFGTEPLVAEALDTLGPLAARYRDEHYSWDDVELPSVRRYAALAPLTAQAIRERLEDAFAAHGIDGWRAVVDAPGERTTFSTNHELRTIFIPSDDDMANRKYALTEDRVRAVVAHEVGTHVLRRTNAERGPLALLAVGLADYLRGEEGVATYAEQKLDGARHYAGGLGYLSVGLAVGLDGTPRTFRGLFDMLRPYMLVSSLEHALAYEDPVDLAALSARVERRAWARSVRTFRGTTGATPGACFTKDIVYREGNIAVWELVAADPAWDEMFTVGKYDPANTEHVEILKELGVL